MIMPKACQLPPPLGDRPTAIIHSHWSHYEHGGLLRELGLLFYTRWCLWSQSAVDDIRIIDHFVKWSRQAIGVTTVYDDHLVIFWLNLFPNMDSTHHMWAVLNSSLNQLKESASDTVKWRSVFKSVLEAYSLESVHAS